MLKLLFDEHRYKAATEGLARKSYMTFCRSYAVYVISKSAANHLEHKLRQVMGVDWVQL